MGNKTNADVTFPKNWQNFLGLGENEADLARFLSEELLLNDFGNTEIEVSGGFHDEEECRSTNPKINVEVLAASHEEAVTHAILGAVHSNADVSVIKARDTDIFAIAIYSRRMSCSKLCILTGTTNDQGIAC